MFSHCAYIVTFVPSILRCNLAETKPGAWRTDASVACARRLTNSDWLAGSTVKTLIRVIGAFFNPCFEGSVSLTKTILRAGALLPATKAKRPLGESGPEFGT